MTEAHIMEKLTEVLVEEFEVEPDEITPEANFFTDLDLDSLDAIDLIVNMDKLLGVPLKSEDAQTIRTVDDFVKLILAKSAG
jgi:acyl carrier protein